MQLSLPMALLVAAAVLATAASAASSRAAVGSPVERVVNLLKDLKVKMEMDEKSEQQVYDKYACWCEKTTARKAAGIKESSDDVRAYGQTILSLKGKVATLASEISELETGIKTNKEEQAQATNIRQRENAAYVAETSELKQAIAALEQAVTVLVAGSQASSLLQAQSAQAKVKAMVDALPASVSMKSDKVMLLSKYLRSGANAKYMPQSFTVQGILKDMYETFVTDLESSTQAEAKANTGFEDLIATKTTELKEMEAEHEKKAGEKAENEQRLADTQQMYDDTTASREADIAFFDETKAACQSKHEDWSTRSSLRDEELAGIGKALDILTSDAARELFGSAIKEGKETGASDKYKTGRDIAPSFVQLASDASPADKAFSALKKSASAGKSFRLAALAVQVKEAKVGHFEKVLVAIDAMVGTLKSEGTADIEKRDQCKNEYLKVESTVKDVEWKIEKNDAKIDKLAGLIELRTQQKMATVASINEVEEQMRTLTEDRTAENSAFKNAKVEDQQAIDLLMQAREALAAYSKNNGVDLGDIQGAAKAVLLQQPEFGVSEDQAPDAVFSGKDHRKGESKGIVSILTMIIEDLNDEIKNGMKGEEVAQLDFEGQMAAAQKLHDDLVARKDSLESAIAKRGAEKADEEEDKMANEGQLNDEKEYKKSITPDCDWIIGAFSKRAEARKQEMEGLAGAKEYLAGQSNQALLETQKAGSNFNDGSLKSIRFLGLRR